MNRYIKNLLFMALAVGVYPNLFAENKVLDKRVRSESGEYGITFAARKKGTPNDFDHAFVIFYFSDPNGHRTVRKAVGFYPAGDVSKVDKFEYKAIFGGEGVIVNDSSESIATEITVIVNKDVFEKATSVKTDFESGKSYWLGWRDCVSFVGSVAEKVPDLNIPNRILNITPAAYIIEMSASN